MPQSQAGDLEQLLMQVARLEETADYCEKKVHGNFRSQNVKLKAIEADVASARAEIHSLSNQIEEHGEASNNLLRNLKESYKKKTGYCDEELRSLGKSFEAIKTRFDTAITLHIPSLQKKLRTLEDYVSSHIQTCPKIGERLTVLEDSVEDWSTIIEELRDYISALRRLDDLDLLSTPSPAQSSWQCLNLGEELGLGPFSTPTKSMSAGWKYRKIISSDSYIQGDVFDGSSGGSGGHLPAVTPQRVIPAARRSDEIHIAPRTECKNLATSPNTSPTSTCSTHLVLDPDPATPTGPFGSLSSPVPRQKSEPMASSDSVWAIPRGVLSQANFQIIGRLYPLELIQRWHLMLVVGLVLGFVYGQRKSAAVTSNSQISHLKSDLWSPGDGYKVYSLQGA